MKDQQHHPVSGLQTDLAAAKEEARKLEAERQQRFRDELSRLDPPERLERAIWLIEHEQVHGPFGTSMPLSSADIARVQKAFLEHVRQMLPGFEEPSERFAYVRDVILNLDLMRDEGDIVRPVREKVVLILESLQDEWATSAQALSESAKRARAELEEAERTHSQTQGSATNWRHLARAAVILARHPDVRTRDDFAERALSMQAELGPSGENPGSAIWRGVHRLGKTILETDHLPDRYLRLEGFRRLVFDLIQGISKLRDKKKTRCEGALSFYPAARRRRLPMRPCTPYFRNHETAASRRQLHTAQGIPARSQPGGALAVCSNCIRQRATPCPTWLQR